ncbi:WxL domain-containing protein [uncultured Vagococcus sp.]|uniref:WxL domain-containing protein n=1 Tax=uncultured Vagococcus sp. TaxID=189676 RepID=UPI0028D46FD8|nr:WxL domain-containing protein [uncultured Vagococcus sp.]
MNIKRTSFVLVAFLAFVPLMRVTAETQTTGKGTVTFHSSDSETPPIDPEKPGEVVEPSGPIVKTEGPLRLDLVPKFTFGPQAISTKDQMYYADAQLFKSDTPARANYAQVTDNRGTVAGWELTVKQETQFSNSAAKNNELKGAVLSLDKQWANSTIGQQFQPTIMKDAIEINQIGASYPIATAERGKGNGTWAIQFGSSGETDGNDNTLTPILNADGSALTDPLTKKPMFKNQAISLFVPGKTLKDPVKYTTVLTWTIAELS